MKKRQCLSAKEQIAQEILEYLSDHPGAGDTLEGIAHWWMTETKIRRQLSLIRQVLQDLTDKGIVSEKKMRSSASVYSLMRR